MHQPFEDELSVESKDVRGIKDSFTQKYPTMKFVSRAAYKLWEIIKENNNLISKREVHYILLKHLVHLLNVQHYTWIHIIKVKMIQYNIL